jgi:hypothetical protein
MKYALKKQNNWTYEFIENECLSNGTHSFVINNILSNLRSKIGNNKEFANIKRKINDLKLFRIQSDYFNIQILSDDAQKSLDYSKEIITNLKKHF